jgi:mannose-1-phosphate guanylyltransferase
MSSAQRSSLMNEVPGLDFLATLVGDYRNNLPRFFDDQTGAVKEGRRDDGRPPFLFSEVTGYAIRDLLLLHSITGERIYLNKALQAADWLIYTASNEIGWIRTRYYFEQDTDENRGLDSFTGGNIFSFDNGICLNGLVALYEAIKSQAVGKFTMKENLQPLAEKIHVLAGNLVAIINRDGSIPAICDDLGTELQFENPRWSQQRGSFQAKIAEALAELYRVTLEEQYADAARQLCRFAISWQKPDGRFITDAKGNTQLHPHCYSAEGVFRVGIILKEESFIASARRATEWALSQCHKGQIAQEIGDTIHGLSCHRTDAQAQVLRLGAQLLQAEILDEKYWQPISDLAESVLAMKHPQEGYFRYGYYEDGTESKTLSYWTNMFAFHSLLEYAATWVSRNLSVIVLAGGIGSRCWPVSCVELPKPLARGLLGGRSLLEETVSRFLKTGCVRPNNVFVLATTRGLEKAQEQMQALGIPAQNIVEERQPKGTLGALQYSVDQLGSRLKDILVVSTADNLIEPLAVFRHTLVKAALLSWWEKSGIMVSLGVPDRECDPRFGHTVYQKTNEMVQGVYAVDRFVEKPQDAVDLEMQEDEAYAWDSGCIVTRCSYIRQIIRQLALNKTGTQAQNLQGDITRQILENQEYRKAVALYSSIIRFVDVGAPGKDLREFFLGTKADRGDSNIFLGSEKVEAFFLSARGNIVISDKKSVVIIGINDHLIIDNSLTNSAVVLPLDRVDALPIMYRMLEGVDGFHPFIVGGEITQQASPHHFAHDCQGQCNTDSSHGLALAINCTNLRLKRSVDRLLVVDQSHTRLSESVVDILSGEKTDAVLTGELLSIAALNANGIGNSVRDLPHWLFLPHELEDYFTKDGMNSEKELTVKLTKLNGLKPMMLDSQALQELIYTASD